MRKVHEKSILLGIGIGMIITSIAGMIYSGGTQKELSKEEIISLAKQYGLVEPYKFLKKDDKVADNTNIASDTQSNSTKTADNTNTASNTNVTNNTKTASNTSVANNTKTSNKSAANTTEADKSKDAKTTNSQLQAESTAAPRNIKIVVQSGFGSKKVSNDLLNKGVITSTEKFTSTLASYNATYKIRVGTYWFRKNDDLQYIIKTICKFK